MPMDDALRRIMAQRMAQGGGGGQAPVATGDMHQGGGMPVQGGGSPTPGGGMPVPAGDGRPGVPTAATGGGGGMDPRTAMLMAARARSRGETPAAVGGTPSAATRMPPTARKAVPKSKAPAAKAKGKAVPKGKVPAKGKAAPKGKAPAKVGKGKLPLKKGTK